MIAAALACESADAAGSALARSTPAQRHLPLLTLTTESLRQSEIGVTLMTSRSGRRLVPLSGGRWLLRRLRRMGLRAIEQVAPVPWSSENIPSSMANLQPRVREKAIEIGNALLAEGMEEGKAIRIAIARAKQWGERHPDRRDYE